MYVIITDKRVSVCHTVTTLYAGSLMVVLCMVVGGTTEDD